MSQLRAPARLRRRARGGTAEPLALPDGGTVVPVTSADGTALHTQVFGPADAPTLVLAHGITQQRRAYAYQVRDLADRFRVVVYDQRGHGRSTLHREPDRFRVELLGQDLHAVLAATVPDGRRAIVAGHSMGGMTIMTWAAQYPDEVARLVAAAVLLNTAPGAILDHIAVIGLPRRTHRVARALVRQRLMIIARTGARPPLRWLALGDVADPVHVEAVAAMARRVPRRTLDCLLYHLTDMDLTPCLRHLTVPTVVVASARDRLLPPIHSTHIADALPELEQFVLLPGVGHMGMWEARERVSSLLADVAARHLAS